MVIHYLYRYFRSTQPPENHVLRDLTACDGGAGAWEFARQAVEEIKKAGMTIHGTFTYGLPGETSEQMQDTKKYLRSLDLDTWQESGTAEIEGSPLHTLTSKGTLEKYKGAQMDAGYQRATDGNIKFQQLAAQLRHSGTDVRQITG